jgi:hypothetical protein
MLKIFLITSLISISNLASSQAAIYNLSYFDKTTNATQVEFYKNLADLNERVTTLNYNTEIFENVKISKIKLGGDSEIGSTFLPKNSEQTALVKRGGEGGGD